MCVTRETMLFVQLGGGIELENNANFMHFAQRDLIIFRMFGVRIFNSFHSDLLREGFLRQLTLSSVMK